MDIKRRNIQYSKPCPVYLLASFGCATTLLSEILCYPLEYIKVKLQMNGTQGCPKYKNIKSLFAETTSTRQYYRAMNAQMLKIIPYSTTRIFAYEFIRTAFTGDIVETTYRRKLSCASSAYAIALLTGNMGDILKIRMINNPELSLVQAIQQSYNKTGFAGFFRGYWLNVITITAIQAVEISLFEKFQRFFVKNFTQGNTSIGIDAISSLLTGISGGVLTAPLDGFKSRFMNQVIDQQTYWKTFISLIKDEGLFGLYKGTLPYCVKMSIGSTLTFVLYEQFKKQII
ncbi:unnamed protein product (macronuclear) [Paramecium tetraurelia]|uniref:Mitochondrial carrier protein n=1 Tax=Paramecium tetraurelia TaxID=5888 RepID=A0CAV1_PARTE|nr:uncharacterized protein GSPATT00036699001 [Paramecium tetraurelia]CAK67918.1 unnamed protein product [Paramecium tetraurelia]|eukprot:XP_001435315.1 hypothetical protein (macronuclear) [Paramecium tetraurelia strain d4-2]